MPLSDWIVTHVPRQLHVTVGQNAIRLAPGVDLLRIITVMNVTDTTLLEAARSSVDVAERQFLVATT